MTSKLEAFLTKQRYNLYLSEESGPVEHLCNIIERLVDLAEEYAESANIEIETAQARIDAIIRR